MSRFTSLLISDPDDLVFGTCPRPVQIAPEIRVGAGQTIPEIKYILPHGSEVSEATHPDIVALYRKMAEGALQRAEELGIEKLIIELELVFEQTLHPGWGEDIVRVTRETMDRYEARGVCSALRTTVADIRDRQRPPRNRGSRETELVVETFERCAPYSHILSIESTGGKEINDPALIACDPAGVVAGLGLLGSNDMEFLWGHIVEIAGKHGTVAGGDTACGFANTAMQLARKRMAPTVFAAMVRAAGAARSLVAIECGATGPDKDCAYEGPVLKAIAGIPISMEGKSAACAHSSHIGNVAMACCDVWSNESVPYVQLFGGFTPEVMLEQLWYDCKLMNAAADRGEARCVRDLLVESDIHTSAEALVLAPESCVRIARAIAASEDYAARTLNAAREALAIITEAIESGALRIPEAECAWPERLAAGLEACSADAGELLEYAASAYGGVFIASEYGLD